MLFLYAGTDKILSHSSFKELRDSQRKITYEDFISHVPRLIIADIFPEYAWPELGLLSGFSKEIQDDWRIEFFQGRIGETDVFFIEKYGNYYLFSDIDGMSIQY